MDTKLGRLLLFGLTIVQNTFLPRLDVAQESDESRRRENVDIFLIANTEMRRKDSGEGKLQRLSGDKTSYFAHIPHSERGLQQRVWVQCGEGTHNNVVDTVNSSGQGRYIEKPPTRKEEGTNKI